MKRKNNDIYFSEQDANYSTYEFLDDTKYLKWIFFSNKSLVPEKISDENLSLFGAGNTTLNEVNLLSQQNSVDYFIIIENIANTKSVSFSGRNGSFGKSIKIIHKHGVSTLYGHLHKLSVKKGQ